MIKSAILRVFFLFFLLQVFVEAKVINLDSALVQANKSHKHLFVFLHRTGCGYCENMIEFTFDDDTIKPFIAKRFIYEHINVSNNDMVIYKDFKGSGREFAKYIGYDFYPTSLFFDDKGEVILVEVGYVDIESIPNETRFYKILNYVDKDLYKEMDFDVSK